MSIKPFGISASVGKARESVGGVGGERGMQASHEAHEATAYIFEHSYNCIPFNSMIPFDCFAYIKRKFAIMLDTLAAQDIKEIRSQYGLTQRSFALLLGIGAASIVRYEQGAQPSKANANLIRAARHPEFMAECLERDGHLIPDRQRVRAEQQISQCHYAVVSLDPEDAVVAEEARKKEAPVNKMTERYHYTLQQEVLNEQAANIIGEIISIKVTDGFSGHASDVFENLLDQVASIKPTIVSNESCDDGVLAAIRGYLQCANELLERQNSGEAA